MSETIWRSVADMQESKPVEVQNVSWGPISVETEVDTVLSAAAVLDKVWEVRHSYAGIVIACFDDPGLDAARELVAPLPVAGIGESAIEEAKRLFTKIGVLIVDDRVKNRVAAHFRKYDVCPEKLVFESLSGSVLDLQKDGDATTARFLAAATRLVNQGADGIVLACAGFGFGGERIAHELQIPVLDGNRLGVTSIISQLANEPIQEKIDAPQPFTGFRTNQPPWVAT